MGNIVIRRYWAGDQTSSQGWRPDPRIARIVMIAPPNHGSSTATRLSDNYIFKTLFGESGRQLGVNWKDLESRLATPDVEFGIIAGGCGNQIGLDPFFCPETTMAGSPSRRLVWRGQPTSFGFPRCTS